MRFSRIALPILLASAAALLAVASPAAAHTPEGCSIILADDFNAENGGTGDLDYADFALWSITNFGTVDLIGNGFHNLLPEGQGLYVDGDGSTNEAGRIETRDKFTFAPGMYHLSFTLAGSQRAESPSDSMVVAVDGFYAETFTRAHDSPMETVHDDITVASPGQGRILFEFHGADSRGLLLDDVVLCQMSGGSPPVPELPTMLLMGAGVALLGFVAMRRKA